MFATTARRPRRKLFFCCDVGSQLVLVIISGTTFYMAAVHLYTWIAFYCPLVLIPHLVLMVLYFLAAFFLLLGAILVLIPLVALYSCLMIGCLVTNVIYIVLLYLSQECICRTVSRFVPDYLSDFSVLGEFFILGVVPGLNFVITLFLLLLCIDYLSEHSDEC